MAYDFSGSTTGSVQIPANATEVYVVSTEGRECFQHHPHLMT
ncbi:hypothetical protein JCM19239_1451 [Vibrio variabilis]|uniref:Uncharacterized protein n=1 Tax=Vibrio variabilis TaxID=990271 RepID=A0ABQ0JG43_9VIBR|nr:hypothetical protein JCM19239_1451 [Vibrio variabilis]